ncbi:MAG: sodium:proton antiporter NhaD [Alphaproteobacteria bacterium]|nr:sodium:proton antiporter NhaD [Alphaproteobacteria bacterium]
MNILPLLFFIGALLYGFPAAAMEAGTAETAYPIPATHVGALFCVAVFIVSYIFVLLEERIHMPKSKPVMLGAAIIWITIALIAPGYDIGHEELHNAAIHGLEEYSSLLLFLLAAMTYINAMEDRKVFATLRVKLIEAGLNMRQLFWATGSIAFFLSPVADNLTTALILGAVILALGKDDRKFVALSCINVVSAANAGGAFSPFGDITTLMVWQAGKVDFFEFVDLFIPSAVNFLVPAVAMSLFIPKDLPAPLHDDVHILRGGRRVILLGLCTIATAVSFEQALGLPPFLGMMAGLSFLLILSYHVRITGRGRPEDNFDVLHLVKRAEWDTLLFFYGIIFSVSGLSFLGYMELASSSMFGALGASYTNVLLGVSSAVIDNIPVMFAVLSMNPDMSHFQWLLITLTTGVGGSMLSIGSAAGVALMGAAKGQYTFMSHLKWTPVLILGYAAAIGAHFLINGHMNVPHNALEGTSAQHSVEAVHKPEISH